MSEDEGPEGLYQVTAPVQLAPEVDGREVVGDHLALLGGLLTQEMAGHVRLQQVSRSNNSEEILSFQITGKSH